MQPMLAVLRMSCRDVAVQALQQPVCWHPELVVPGEACSQVCLPNTSVASSAYYAALVLVMLVVPGEAH
jgi:hypothetical protein